MSEIDDLEDLNAGKADVVLEDDVRRSVFVLGPDGQGYPLPRRRAGFDLRPRRRRVRVKAGSSRAGGEA